MSQRFCTNDGHPMILWQDDVTGERLLPVSLNASVIRNGFWRCNRCGQTEPVAEDVKLRLAGAPCLPGME